MKRFLLLLLVLLLCTGCGEKGTTKTVLYDQQEYVIDTEAQTITVDGDVYQYEYEQNTCKITYPNGGIYWWTTAEGAGYGGWDMGYDEEKYIEGSKLIDVLETKKNHSRESQIPFVFAFLFAALGLWMVIAPYTSWYLSHGWKYKNAEPSDLALGAIRLEGVVLLIVAVVLFFR